MLEYINNLNIYYKTLIILIIYEILLMIKRKMNRRYLYKKAQKRAREQNKKLLVIGDPYNGLASITTGIDYDCGDLCIDVTGCELCKNKLKSRLEDAIQTINLNEYVMYISCVLEYVDDLPLILNYLNKIDKNDRYIVTVEWYSLSAYLYPYFITNERPPKYIIYSTGNEIKYYLNPIHN